MDAGEIARACADAMWAEDSASKGLGMQLISVEPGRAVLAMAVTETMVNGHNICHGGFIFTLADSAFAFACNTYDQRTVAQQDGPHVTAFVGNQYGSGTEAIGLFQCTLRGDDAGFLQVRRISGQDDTAV